MIQLPEIRAALSQNEANRLPPPEGLKQRAAVSLVFCGPAQALSLCFILRAQRAGDRWSGQMAFPGGRAERGDASPQHTARRETWEELGLELRDESLLGALPEVPIMRSRNVTDGVLSPFAFYVGNEPVPLAGNEEVADAWWIGLDHLWDPANRTTVDFEYEGAVLQFPGIQFGEQAIWGLTLRVLTRFGELLGRPLPVAW